MHVQEQILSLLSPAGYKRVYHGGNIFGYDSQLWLLPSINVGIIVLTNGPNDADAVHAIETIIYYVSDLLTGEWLWLNTSTACTFPAPWVHDADALSSAEGLELSRKPNTGNEPQASRHQRPLTEYVGRYGHYGLGYAYVTLANATTGSGEALHFQHGKHGTGILSHTDVTDKFHVTFYGLLWFITNSSQAIDTDVYFRSTDDDDDVLNELVIPWMSPDVETVFIKDLNIDSGAGAVVSSFLLLICVVVAVKLSRECEI